MERTNLIRRVYAMPEGGHLSTLPVGLLLLIAGVSLFFHQAIIIRRLKRGRIHAQFNLRNVSIQSIYCAAIVIAIGIILVGIGTVAFEN